MRQKRPGEDSNGKSQQCCSRELNKHVFNIVLPTDPSSPRCLLAIKIHHPPTETRLPLRSTIVGAEYMAGSRQNRASSASCKRGTGWVPGTKRGARQNPAPGARGLALPMPMPMPMPGAAPRRPVTVSRGDRPRVHLGHSDLSADPQEAGQMEFGEHAFLQAGSGERGWGSGREKAAAGSVCQRPVSTGTR